MKEKQECEHCPDGHPDPAKRPWSVWVTETRVDGEPPYLMVAPADSTHVSESDAQWLRELISKRRPSAGLQINVMNPVVENASFTVQRMLKQQRGFGGPTAA